MSNQFYTCVIITHMGSIQNILLCGVYVCVFWADSYYSISLSDLLQALYHAWYVYIYTIGKIIYIMPSSPVLISFFLPSLSPGTIQITSVI